MHLPIMSFNSNFDRAFIDRSLQLVQEYTGPHDATLLLNCLLGLLIVPKESCLASIPKKPIEDLASWGISPSAITAFGRADREDEDPHNLRGLVWRLRNSVAHFRFRPEPEDGEVVAFHFHDKSGFKATVQLSELRIFVERLAKHVREL
ncbi:HEPN family nuclease [Hydrogenophaga sp. IBVHS1]|uniref:HEPN family nuclease n=2 Tax=unclassified Hydrogenophaga TaxID=2610897 RepID=UPI0015C4EDCD|nr:HEPN family nuclease [Hydrogenophaga sp. IBVHS1]